MLDVIRNEVYKCMGKDASGHNNDHIKRVYDLSMKFANDEDVDLTVVGMIALLHDVDDYKLVSKEESSNMTNTKRILSIAKVDENTQKIVLSELSRFGYSKSLDGIRPLTKEGQIVSDADMCDGMGVNGFLRCYQYNLKHGYSVFDRNNLPIHYNNSSEYKNSSTSTVVNHMFDKLLRLKNLMLTKPGKIEAESRHEILVDILYHLFEEENAPEWIRYLEEFEK